MSDLYYDPWDVEIDLDPYPTYRRLRDGQPLIYNERHDFWGLSRYADVDAALRDPNRLSSAKGDLLEVVKTDPVIPEPRLTPPGYTGFALLLEDGEQGAGLEDEVGGVGADGCADW